MGLVMQSTWEDAHSTLLRELVDKGVTFSEVARALNARFNTAYTRNAAIGRARRMGLSLPAPTGSSSVFQAPKRADVRRISKKRARMAATPPAKSSTPTQQRAASLQLRCVAITPRYLALVDLEPADCRYP